MAAAETIGFTILSTLAVLIVVEGQDCQINYKEPELEDQLKETLFCEYDTDDRPVKNSGDTLKVQMGIDVKRIVTSEEEQNQPDKVTIYSSTIMAWNDPFLRWDHVEKYISVYTLFVPSEKLWMPNIIVTNSKFRQSTRELDARCLLLQGGDVTCVAFASYETYCRTDFRHWPYDSMNCTLKFSALMKSGEVLNLTMFPFFNEKPIKTDLNDRHHYWKLESTTATYGVPGWKALNMTYPFISYSFILSRHTATWAALIVGPILVLVLMTLISYVLDVASTERLSILATSMICHFFYLLQIYWYLPSSGNTCPLIVMFVRGSMIISIVAVLETIMLSFLEGCTSAFVYTILNLLEKVPGKMFTFKGFHKMETAESDENNATSLKWLLLTVFLNRMFLTFSFAAYAIMFIAVLIM